MSRHRRDTAETTPMTPEPMFALKVKMVEKRDESGNLRKPLSPVRGA